MKVKVHNKISIDLKSWGYKKVEVVHSSNEYYVNAEGHQIRINLGSLKFSILTPKGFVVHETSKLDLSRVEQFCNERQKDTIKT